MRLFRSVRPWGLILFARNILAPDQVRSLTAVFREEVGRADAPVMTDQEGGRVQRLAPSRWRAYPSARALAGLGVNLSERLSLVRLGARLIAHDLNELGINVDLAPVLDLPAPDGDRVIGDRAFSNDPHLAAQLGRAVCEGLLAGGVLPVLKHIPGHGRARTDSHERAPVVDADLPTLCASDVAPFRALSDMPAALTAHVVYSSVDPSAPATVSKPAIDALVREAAGFAGLLVSDDLSMGALDGDVADRAARARRAGCDIVLYGAGDLAGSAAAAAGAGTLHGVSQDRAERALSHIRATQEPFEPVEAAARFAAAVAGWSAR
jgi:beta-N-acetylhexosaminidase